MIQLREMFILVKHLKCLAVKNLDIILGFIFLATLVSIPWLIAALFGAYTGEDNSSLIRISLFLKSKGSLIVTSIFAIGSFLVLKRIYGERSSQSPLILYLKIGLGAASIPIFSAWVTYLHYNGSPSEYHVSKESLAYFEPHTNSFVKKTSALIERNKETTKVLDTARSKLLVISNLSKTLEIEKGRDCLDKDNRLRREYENYIDLKDERLTVCVFHIKDGEKVGVENIILQIRDRKTKEILVNFTTIFSLYPQTCPIYEIFLDGNKLKSMIQARDLQNCFEAGLLGIRAHNSSLEEKMTNSAVHPPYSIFHMVLHRLSRSVGADFKLIEPIGFWSGILSVIWSILLAAYFFVFAGVVLSRQKHN